MAEAARRKRKLFAGISLDDPARTRCVGVSNELRKAGFAARYETAEKLHVTLAFLGFVDPERTDAVGAALERVAARRKSFELTLDKLGAFPYETKPRVVYVGARAQGAEFRALANDLRGEYARLGFEFRDDAIAHVTIARVKASKRSLPFSDFEPIKLRVNALTLFESLPDPAQNTSRYEIAQRAILSGGALWSE
jgi:2'-5' RNA ligase